MPLTPFQTAIARMLAQQRSEDSYLAGGAAILLEPETERFSNDLDYFHDSEARVEEAYRQDRRVLEEAGYDVQVELNRPGYVRAVVSRERENESTKIEWARDSAWRFMPPVRDERVGYRLHPIDLAVNKVLALAGRDEARDVVDTLRFHRTLLPLGPLCWAACGKDPGFTPWSLLDLLQRRGTVRPEDLKRLRLERPLDPKEVKAGWLEAIRSVKPFLESRPAEEVGCLYYSAGRKAFVDPRDVDDAVPHFGRPGGVLPQVDP